MTLDVNFSTKLFNLKIQRVQLFIKSKTVQPDPSKGPVKTPPVPDTFPYVLHDEQIGALSKNADYPPGCLVPTVHKTLVEPAMLNGADGDWLGCQADHGVLRALMSGIYASHLLACTRAGRITAPLAADEYRRWMAEKFAANSLPHEPLALDAGEARVNP